ADKAAVKTSLTALINKINIVYELAFTLGAYISAFTSTNSFDKEAFKAESEYDIELSKMHAMNIRFIAWIGKVKALLPALTKEKGLLQDHKYFLDNAARQSKFLMSPIEEDLTTELSLSGTTAWSKLQGTVTSQLSVDFELDGKVQKLSAPALINLRAHPDESVRRRAYEKENEVWESVKEPLAAAINGVKGWELTISRRRGRKSPLEVSLENSHIDQKTLDAMLTAIRESLPMYEKYFKTKAKLLGKKKLPWWDLFAPVGKDVKTYSWPEAREFVLNNFAKFSPSLHDYGKKAFDNNWIDAEQYSGKRGGAFCMGVPSVKESRVLMSFDGSLDVVSTLAHELGHGFHNECAFQQNRTMMQQDTPMTLAETASIMNETIVMEAVLAETKTPAEALPILEALLQNDSQVVVDIYSRFLFESRLFEARKKSEVAADDIGELMLQAQKDAYGNGLDPKYMQKFMWTWKPHYYFGGAHFYNFPYTFGLLFGLGLYAIFKERGAAFVPQYEDLLAATGMEAAAPLAKRFGIDITKPDFWRSSLAIIGKRIDRFAELARQV
ncbi:MAG TPA: M3 family oligoendopeptidase, partial [Bellilinea sp.]|nr:M3 family oligoendopeptidase [Bellilinea sp.]